MNTDIGRKSYHSNDVASAVRLVLGRASSIGLPLPQSLLYTLVKRELPGLTVGEFNKAVNTIADAGYLGYHRGVIFSGTILKGAWDGNQ